MGRAFERDFSVGMRRAKFPRFRFRQRLKLREIDYINCECYLRWWLWGCVDIKKREFHEKARRGKPDLPVWPKKGATGSDVTSGIFLFPLSLSSFSPPVPDERER
jgi:hypothetical protein